MSGYHAPLIYTMVLMSAADRNMTDAELSTIGDILTHLPVFASFDRDTLPAVAAQCVDLLDDKHGLDRVLTAIVDGLPEKLYETAYALACDVVASDNKASQEELRLLEILRDRLDIDRLVASAIERAARARFIRP